MSYATYTLHITYTTIIKDSPQRYTSSIQLSLQTIIRGYTSSIQLSRHTLHKLYISSIQLSLNTLLRDYTSSIQLSLQTIIRDYTSSIQLSSDYQQRLHIKYTTIVSYSTHTLHIKYTTKLKTLLGDYTSCVQLSLQNLLRNYTLSRQLWLFAYRRIPPIFTATSSLELHIEQINIIRQLEQLFIYNYIVPLATTYQVYISGCSFIVAGFPQILHLNSQMLLPFTCSDSTSN